MKDFDLSYMGPMLKKARIDANITQEDLAERIGVTPRYIMAIENEGQCPSLEKWVRLIRALHTSADAIIYPEYTLPEDDRLIRLIRTLSDRDRKILQATIQAMIDNQSRE